MLSQLHQLGNQSKIGNGQNKTDGWHNHWLVLSHGYFSRATQYTVKLFICYGSIWISSPFDCM